MQEILIALAIGILIGAVGLYFFFRKSHLSNHPTLSSSTYSSQEVESLLFKAGYTIVTKQPKASILTTIDDKEHLGTLNTDYIVQKEKEKYVVVVKTGQEAGDPLDPIFRRRLIELQAAYGTKALLMVDPNEGSVHSVNFRFVRERNLDGIFRVFIGAFIIGVIIGIIWMLVQLHLF
ncbi:MAG: hypothetical protein WC890_07595 [Candidatus Margulisiibacteriota bacterium]